MGKTKEQLYEDLIKNQRFCFSIELIDNDCQYQELNIGFSTSSINVIINKLLKVANELDKEQYRMSKR